MIVPKKRNFIKIEIGEHNMMIYDNTLREGLQNPNVFLNVNQKLRILQQQIKTGIKNIEIGFIAIDERERNELQYLINQDLPANLFCLSRLMIEDVDACLKIGCKNITLFVPSSDELINLRIKKDISQIESMIKQVVSYANNKGMYVRFSCEDATRTPVDRLIKFYTIAEDNGARVVSVPDTCGILTPTLTAKLIKELRDNLKCKISMHCHNDLGLATANALSGAEAGADEIQATINGVGERIGNSDLSEIIIIFRKYFQDECKIDLIEMKKLYNLFSSETALPIRSEKPIMGSHQFTHESGLHVRAVIENSHCYEAFPPKWLGEEHKILYGKMSGLANVEYFLTKNSIEMNQKQKMQLLNIIKRRGYEEKRCLSDEDLLEIINLTNN